MYLNSDEKVEIFEKYGKGKTDTGSPEAQIALFSVRISHLTEHLKSNHKDHTTERALKMLVGKRRRLLDYLKRKDISRYRAIIAQKSLVSASKHSLYLKTTHIGLTAMLSALYCFYAKAGKSSLKTMRCTPFSKRLLEMRKCPISDVCFTCEPAHRHWS